MVPAGARRRGPSSLEEKGRAERLRYHSYGQTAVSEPRSCCQRIEYHQILRLAHLVLGREARRPRAPPGQQEKREAVQGPPAGQGSAGLTGGAGDSSKAGRHVSGCSFSPGQWEVWLSPPTLGPTKGLSVGSRVSEEDEVQAGRQEADAPSAAGPADQGAATSTAPARRRGLRDPAGGRVPLQR